MAGVAPESTLDRTFRALADPTRRAILAQLRAGPASVTALAAPFSISFAAVSKHLRVLEDAGLVSRENRGRERRCHLQAQPLRAAAAFAADYRAFWNARLDALETFLADDAQSGPTDD
ncbi:MAG: metalloregulator ArsR/SmtB family transcription factor [Myxococcota bacterium]